jgi:response regulator RpfG family c-di-GMP phosphodiesterase
MSVKVLFVDDEENILRSLRRLFMDDEFESVAAMSGAEGLELIGNGEGYALIVSDQRMPGLKGSEFLAQVREKAPDAQRILLTGYADIDATIDAINRGGACRYISKPWNEEELRQAVREAVGRYQLLQENRRLSELVQRQNEELKEWNSNLKQRVLEQTGDIRKKNEELQELIDRLRKNFEDTIDAFSNLVELHNPEVRSHSRMVARIAVRAATLHGLPEQEAETVRVAALLHDIGKIGISPGSSLNGLADLSGDDLAEYVLHPVRGQAAVDGVEDLRQAGMLIRHHHEHYDGSGFPDRLRGGEIPTGAQLIGMADYLELFLRCACGDNAVELALAELKKNLGSRFDTALFPAVAGAAREVCALFQTKNDLVEREVSFAGLSERMVLARDLFSGTGLLLLSTGTELDAVKIEALKRFYRLDPPKGGVFIFARR